MISGLGAIPAANGQMIYWTRWAFYAASCSFLMVEISMILGKNKKKMVEIISLNVLVMVTGLLASVTEGVIKWLFFIYSSVAFFLILVELIRNSNKKFITMFVLFFWSGFPVVWIFSPAGLMILDAMWTAISYLILDLITKVYFGIHTTRKYKEI